MFSALLSQSVKSFPEKVFVSFEHCSPGQVGWSTHERFRGLSSGHRTIVAHIETRLPAG